MVSKACFLFFCFFYLQESYHKWENPTKKELWGGKAGRVWNYQPNGAITEINVHYGKFIDSVSFKSVDEEDQIYKFGGNGGNQAKSFKIDWPRDYLASISGTYSRTYENRVVIQSLCFKTHQGAQYGPFGDTNDKDATSFEFSMEGWIIVGFFGQDSNLLDGIGVYAKPYADLYNSPNRVQMFREKRDVQPVRFLLNIESYSLLPNEEGKKYESVIFRFGGFKWKLILYPHGDETPDGKGYISLYLAIHESAFIARDENFMLCADLKYFVLNKKTNKYLTIRDAKGAVMCFDKLRSVQGFSQLLSSDTFKDPSNEYLVDDACTFGVEFFIIQPSSRARVETLTMVKDPEGTPDNGRVLKDSHLMY